MYGAWPCSPARGRTPRLALWDDVPAVQMELGADVSVHMPFDEERCGQLNALLKHLTLRLGLIRMEDEEWSRAALCVDGKEAVSFAPSPQAIAGR